MESFLLVSGVQIQAHDLEGQSFLVQLVGLLHFGLVDQLAERALLPLLVVPLLPVLLGLLQGFFEVFLVFSVVELVGKVSRIGVGQVPVHDLDVAGTNHDLQVLSQLG